MPSAHTSDAVMTLQQTPDTVPDTVPDGRRRHDVSPDAVMTPKRP